MDTSSSVLRRGYLPVFAGAVCISFAAFFVKGSGVDPSAVAFYRLLFGGAALFVVAAVRRLPLRPTRSVAPLVFMAGAFFCVDLLFWHQSIVLVGPGIATIVTNFQVIVLGLYDAFVLKNPISRLQYLSVPVAFAGLFLLLGLHENSLPSGVLMGVVYGLLSAVFYASYVLTLRKTQSMKEKLPAASNMAWVSVLGAGCIGVYCVVTGASLAVPDGVTLAKMAGLGVFCQSVGWLLLSMGLPHLTPFRAGLIMLTQPALSFIWDMIVYGTASGAVNILGACIAIAAIGMGIRAPEPATGQRPEREERTA